ncbi:hypothetical protein E0E52_07770 [Azotobacter chroococcum]|uniref:hypothetical protein n=1 Tax=Azotobacter chroococcum TaxID=353 RepID=UPI00103D9034|nr:hypothetical protein [Azotobacter chroococcum]TBW09316.1 hypothetical protein E0E52_07770 [Azotobacter chroococcum]
MIFATLVWIDEKNLKHDNNKSNSIFSYLRQARLLAKSLHQEIGKNLCILTNRPEICNQFFSEKTSWQPLIIETPASISPPDGIKFYSAHHKLSALAKILELLKIDSDDRFFLLDSDIYVNKALSASQIFALSSADLTVYNISDQVFPVYGGQRISNEIDFITKSKITDPQWFGGEFLSGNSKGLSCLIEKANDLIPTYFENHEKLHHLGDEMYISCAINTLRQDSDIKINTANNYYFCSRHWSRHTDRPLSWHFKHSFIHCPGSKPVLEIFSKTLPISTRSMKTALALYQVFVITYQIFKKIAKRQN